MDTIFAPWRMAYIGGKRPPGCPLCRDSCRADELVVQEGKCSFIMVNRYPYTGGHLMIVPFRHLNRICDLTLDEKTELFGFVDLSVRVLTDAMNPEGFNIGMNMGKAGGAGIEDHLHLHVVPRWCGDTNFMSVIGEVRVIPADAAGTAEQLRPFFERFQGEVCG